VADKKEKEEGKKKRRIRGDAFWKLRGFQKKVDKFQEELAEWEMEKLEELKLYPDQINWITGAIVDANAIIEEGRVISGQIVGRLPHEVIKAHKKEIEKLKEIDKELITFLDDLSNKLNIWPDMIDLKTGVIKDEGEYESVNPDTPVEEEKEKEVEETE